MLSALATPYRWMPDGRRLRICFTDTRSTERSRRVRFDVLPPALRENRRHCGSAGNGSRKDIRYFGGRHPHRHQRASKPRTFAVPSYEEHVVRAARKEIKPLEQKL